MKKEKIVTKVGAVLLTAAMCISSMLPVCAEAKTEMKSAYTYAEKEDTWYSSDSISFDLDGDGDMEELSIRTSCKDNGKKYSQTYGIYVDGNVVTKKTYKVTYAVAELEVCKLDNGQILFIADLSTDNDYFSCGDFYLWENGKLVEQKIAKNKVNGSYVGVKGNYIVVNGPKTKSMKKPGRKYNCYAKESRYQCKNGKLVLVSSKWVKSYRA